MSTLKVGDIKHESFTGTTQLKLDSAGRLLVGTTTEGASGADQFTVASSSHGGLTIRSGSTSNGNLMFSDGTSGAAEYAGYVQYEHDNNKLNIGANGSTRLTIDSIGRLLMGGTSPEMNENGFNEIVIGGKSEGAAITLQDDNSNVKGGLFSSDANLAMIIRTVTNHPLEFRTNNTHRMRLDTSGNLVIKGSATSDNNRMQIRVNDTQNEFRGSSNSGTSRGFAFYASNTNVSEIATLDSDGLKFGSDTAAANALDDYEEGSFTLAVSAMTVSAHNENRYVKIGSLVYVTARVTFGSTGDGSRIVSMSGLPYTPLTSNSAQANVVAEHTFTNTSGGGLSDKAVAIVIESDGNLRFKLMSDQAELIHNNVYNQSFRFSLTYTTT